MIKDLDPELIIKVLRDSVVVDSLDTPGLNPFYIYDNLDLPFTPDTTIGEITPIQFAEHLISCLQDILIEHFKEVSIPPQINAKRAVWDFFCEINGIPTRLAVFKTQREKRKAKIEQGILNLLFL